MTSGYWGGFGASGTNSGCQGLSLVCQSRIQDFGAGFGVSESNLGCQGLALGCQGPIWDVGASFGVSGAALGSYVRYVRAGFGVSGGFWGAFNPDLRRAQAALPSPPSPQSPDAHAPLPRLRRTPRPQNGGGLRAPPAPHGSRLPGPRRALTPESPPLPEPRVPAAPGARHPVRGRPWSGAAPSTRCPRRSARYELWKCQTPTLGAPAAVQGCCRGL